MCTGQVRAFFASHCVSLKPAQRGSLLFSPKGASGWLFFSLRKWLGFEAQSSKQPYRRRPVSLRVEVLEDRITPNAVTTLWVDSTPGAGGTAFTSTGGTQPAVVAGLVPGVTIFSTISAAVSAASAGVTINVSDGTYAELVTVNKALTIRGNQFGADARTRATGNETITTGAAGSTSFYITSNDVTVDGFTVQGATNANQFGFGIVVGPGMSGAHILDDIVQNNISGLSLANANNADQAVIQHNLFASNNAAGPSSGDGIYSDQYNAGGHADQRPDR
jgi:hypothetical protein